MAKIALAKGEEHVNGKGTIIKAKSMGPGCSRLCRFRCHERLHEPLRKSIFESYYKTVDASRKWDFVNNCIKVKSPMERRGTGGDDQIRKRDNTIRYHFTETDGTEIKVCRSMFTSTLGISKTVVQTVVRKRLETNFTRISPDKRGSHAQHKKISEIVKQSVRDHINSIPRVPSHYCRARSRMEYLLTDLSITGLYRTYEEWMEERYPGQTKASKRVYNDIYNSEFNLSNQKQKKDLCDLCLVYETKLNERQKAARKEEYDIHRKRKEVARQKRNEDKEQAAGNPEICFCTFDLQKVHTVPQDDGGALFYSSKLSMYNFTIWEGNTRAGYCYVWHEGEALRGANEVASSVLNFIQYQLQNNPQIKTFIFYSDNCSGQNKNKYLFAMYTYASAKFNITIIHRYLEKGHTENAGDTMHSCIERFCKKKRMYIPEEWYQNILLSSQVTVHRLENGKKISSREPAYKLVRMNDKIFDFHNLVDQQKWANHRGVTWTNVREIQTHPDNPSQITVKHDFDEDPLELNVAKNSRGRPFLLRNYELKKAYNGPLQLRAKKLQHLWKLCKKLIIPSRYHDFYKSLVGFPDLNLDLEEGDVVVPENADRVLGEQNLQNLLDEMADDDIDYDEWLAN